MTLRFCRCALAMFATVLLLGACATASLPQQVYIVRHAEKLPGDDPALTDAGLRRAEALADRLAAAGITRIFSTDTQRTRATAAPLAARLGLDVELYDAEHAEQLAETVRASGGHTLIVGHSNTIAELAAVFGAESGPAVSDEEYDRLYVILADSNEVRGERRRYGERSVFSDPEPAESAPAVANQ